VSIAAEPFAEQEGLRARVALGQAEVVIVLGASALVAVHLLDDSFVQREAGTTVADHLFSGLVPLAFVAAAAVGYTRLRPGRRAAVAVLLGIAGIVTGAVEPAFYGPKEGLSGDDYSGLLAAAAGASLILVAGVTAWRGRRLGDSHVWRYGRRLLLAAAWLLGLFFVVFPLSLSYGFTHVARTGTATGDLGAPYESVAFDASDGLRLSGWFVPSKNGATVIVYPGKRGTQKHARMLVRNGFGVLVFDRRGEGASEGDPNALGWGFDRDLRGALDYLRGRDDVDAERVGGLGLSVGGEAFLQTAAETTAVKAVVSDGAGSRSVREDTVHVHAGKLPEIAISGVMTAGMALFSNRLPPQNLKDLAGRITTTPVFFIYATKGAGGEENTPDYYAAARGRKQIWLVETTHTHGLTTRPLDYERRVVRFFDRALRG